MKTHFDITHFAKFCKQTMGIETKLKKVREKRKKPQIPLFQIMWSVINMVPLGIKSFLSLDLWGRMEEALLYIESKRKQVCSDTTYERICSWIDVKELASILLSLVKNKTRKEKIGYKLVKGGRYFRMGTVDGSEMGKQYGSAVGYLGERFYFIGFERMEKYGKELKSSREALNKIAEELGKGWCELLLVDGLYMDKKDFEYAKEKWGCDLLVKTGEERLDVIKDARGLFFSSDYEERIEIATGIDEERSIEYEIRAASGFFWGDLKYPLRVAYVKERHLKPLKNRPEVVEFWVITTREDISGEEMREAAHSRWQTENNGFKLLNSLVSSKKVHSHKLQVFCVYILLWMIGFTLLEAFLSEVYDKGVVKLPKGIRFTYNFFWEELRRSLCLLLLQPADP